jgi:hypothetical protein
MGGSCSTYRLEERYMQDFGGKLLGKKTLERPGRRWEHNIKIDLQEVGWGDRLDCFGP